MVSLDRLQEMYEDHHRNKAKQTFTDDMMKGVSGENRSSKKGLIEEVLKNTNAPKPDENPSDRFRFFKYLLLAIPLPIYLKIRSAGRK